MGNSKINPGKIEPGDLKQMGLDALNSLIQYMLSPDWDLAIKGLPEEKQAEAQKKASDLLAEAEKLKLKLANAELAAILDRLKQNEQALKKGTQSLKTTLNALKTTEEILKVAAEVIKIIGRIVALI